MSQPLDTITITSILQSGSAFALTEGKALQDVVFIPGTVARHMPLIEGQTIKALLVPNTKRPDSAPWLATRLSPKDEPASDAMTAQACEVARTLLHSGGVWTDKQVYASCANQHPAFAHASRGLAAAANALDMLYQSGEAVRVVVQHTGEIESARWYTRDVDRLRVTVEARP